MNEKNHEYRKNLVIDAMIIVGFFFIILGFCLLCVTVRRQSIIQILLPFFVDAVGVFSLSIYFFLRKRLIFFGFGLAAVLTGVCMLMVAADFIPFSLAQAWPLFLVFVAISLFTSGCMHFKRVHPAYSIPAIILAALGVVFFLFSTDIISMTLRNFVALWWPVFFILGGLLVVLLFFDMRRKNS